MKKVKKIGGKNTFVLRIGALVCVMAISVLLLCSCCSQCGTVISENREQYELITSKNCYPVEGEISGGRWHISGNIGSKEVYRIYYWVDKTTREANSQTIYAEDTKLFFDIEEGEIPYIVIIHQTVDDCFQGDQKRVTYELHLPEDAIIQEFQIAIE